MRAESIHLPAAAVLALVLAFTSLYADASRDRSQQMQVPSPPAALIRCATASERSPCGLDPAMQRMGFPPQPYVPPFVDPPRLLPSH